MRSQKRIVALLHLGIMAFAFFAQLSASPVRAERNEGTEQDRPELRTAPLLRGAIWWIRSEYTEWTEEDWSKESLERAIQAQRDIGFDLLWIFNTPSLLNRAEQQSASGVDILETIYDIADSHGMRVIADLPKGGWYGKTTAEDILATNTKHIRRYQARYGQHASFWGWYLNYEINPISPDDVEQSLFWRSLWHDIVDECRCSAPDSMVTISPFFLLDETRRRGFVYLTPEQLAGWWGKTLQETGIGILMLQDSGEHCSFFTLKQREPFFAHMADACHQAGAQFWVNVETGEVHVPNWDEFLASGGQDNLAPFRFTPIDWLEKKLELAARYGDGIINWGYFPFMDPISDQLKPGEIGEAISTPLEAYQDYKVYYTRVKDKMALQEDK